MSKGHHPPWSDTLIWPSAMTPDPSLRAYRQLAAAIVELATRDAKSSNGYAAEARTWLTDGGGFVGDLLDGLEISHQAVEQWVGDLPALQQPALPLG